MKEVIKLWKEYLAEMAIAQSKATLTQYTPTFEGFMKWVETNYNTDNQKQS